MQGKHPFVFLLGTGLQDEHRRAITGRQQWIIVLAIQPAITDTAQWTKVSQVADLFFSGTPAAFVLHGNTYDLFRVDGEESPRYGVLAEFLAARPEVESIYYPGLKGHPGFDLHSRQATGGGSVISFTTGDVDGSKRFVESTKLCSISVSFGSVNSSLSLPCYMSHASIPDTRREQLAPPPDLIRLSIGIEDIDDVFAELDRILAFGFDAAKPKKSAAVASNGHVFEAVPR